MKKSPRPESERAAAARLSDELGLNICRATVRRLKAKGVDLLDPEAVGDALANQERKPRQTAPKARPAPSGDMPAAPLTSDELDARLGALEAELLNAPDYESARRTRVQISGYRELVRVQKDREQLIDRATVEEDGRLTGEVFKHACYRVPHELIPKIIGLDYAAAFEIAENWAYDTLLELHRMNEKDIGEILAKSISVDITTKLS